MTTGNARRSSRTTPARVLLAAEGSGAVRELRDHGFRVHSAHTPADVKATLSRGVDMVVLDDACADLATSELIARANQQNVSFCLLLVDEYGPDALARALEVGADAFLARDAPPEELLRVLRQELRHEPPAQPRRCSLSRLVGRSPEIREICRLISLLAPSSAPVLITGESGTGKELVARAIHRFSPRRHHPFVAINCGAIPENLLESELFGHEKGAFTGATRRRIGRFELADGGTLFLDEIGELAPNLQVKLLRILQEQRFERVGGTETVEVDVRVLTATHRSLEEMVELRSFRLDLFYRLNVLNIHVPPLRERPVDIKPLWEHFLRAAAREEGRDGFETDRAVHDMLRAYDWPGNVRELENLARRIVTLRAHRSITPQTFPGYVSGKLPSQRSLSFVPGMTLDELERLAILKTYESVDSIRETAELLGVSERKIYYRLKEYREEGVLDFESDVIEDTPGV